VSVIRVATNAVIATATNTLTATIPVGVSLSGIAILVAPPASPTNKAQCKDGGWMTFTNPKFKNQGACVSYVNHPTPRFPSQPHPVGWGCTHLTVSVRTTS